MEITKFTHLHTHSEYSLLDGANRIKELIPYVKSLGMQAIAITDHGFMGGTIEFYKECQKQQIKPIIGIEAYITDDPDECEKRTRDNMHMVLLAKDNIGYSKLLRLLSYSAFSNFYYKPRIYKDNLKELAGHVIATSACLGGILASKLEFIKNENGIVIGCQDTDNKFIKDLDFYLDIFGNDFYIELQNWNGPEQTQLIYNNYLIDIGKKRNLPFVITSDAHYLKKEDTQIHELLMAMQLGKTLDEYRSSGDMQYGPYFYVQSQEEILNGAKQLNCEEAVYQTINIANQCNVTIELGHYKPPVFDIELAEDYQEFLQYKKQGSLECIGVK